MNEDEVRASERAKIVWWLRAAATGPASFRAHPVRIDTLEVIAKAIEEHPERFAEAPDER